MKKKMFSLILAVMMIFALVSCDEGTENVSSENVSSVVSFEQSSDVSSDASSDMPSDVPSDVSSEVPATSTEPPTIEEMTEMNLADIDKSTLSGEELSYYNARYEKLFEAWKLHMYRPDSIHTESMKKAAFNQSLWSISITREKQLIIDYEKHLEDEKKAQEEREKKEKEEKERIELYKQNYTKLMALPEIEAIIPAELPEYVPGSITLGERVDTNLYQYRCVWYARAQGTEQAIQLVLEQERGYGIFDIINPETGKLYYREMMMAWCGSEEDVSEEHKPTESKWVYYITYFRITREEMEQIAEVLRTNLFYDKDRDAYWALDETNGIAPDTSLEVGEVPNLDILYTLDSDIINHYYRRA